MNQVSNGLQRSGKFVMASGGCTRADRAGWHHQCRVPFTGRPSPKNSNYIYGENRQSSRAYAIGLWGDLPYSAEQAVVIPNLIADMNSQDLAFTAHDGDLRQGSGAPNCSGGTIYTRGAG